VSFKTLTRILPPALPYPFPSLALFPVWNPNSSVPPTTPIFCMDRYLSSHYSFCSLLFSSPLSPRPAPPSSPTHLSTPRAPRPLLPPNPLAPCAPTLKRPSSPYSSTHTTLTESGTPAHPKAPVPVHVAPVLTTRLTPLPRLTLHLSVFRLFLPPTSSHPYSLVSPPALSTPPT